MTGCPNCGNQDRPIIPAAEILAQARTQHPGSPWAHLAGPLHVGDGRTVRPVDGICAQCADITMEWVQWQAERAPQAGSSPSPA